MMMIFSNVRRAVAALIVATAATGVPAVHAQQPSAQSSAPPNALQGFSQNRDKPIKINADSLDVRDKDKMATFSGDVHLVQGEVGKGEVDLRSKTLVVFYDDQPPPAQPVPAPSKGGKASAVAAELPPQQQNQQSQQIKRVEARGGVIVKQKEQTATGDLGIFDMRANTVEMTGNVAISQGPNLLRGDNLIVNMTTGESFLTCGKNHEKCRVQALIQPGSVKPEGQQATPAHQTREAPRPHTAQP